MAKQRKIEISIPEPCSEDWDKMTADEQGKFCSNCQKSVVDFSSYTDRELLDYFTKAKGMICGKVSNHQLNRLIVANSPSDTSVFRRLLLGAALTAGVAGVAQGQNTPIKDTNTRQTLNTLSDRIANDRAHKSAEMNYLNGQVVDDSTNALLPFCEVVLETSTGRQLAGTMTDQNGHFQFLLTKELQDLNLVLLFEYEGYKDLKVNLKLDKFPYENISHQYQLVAVADNATTVGALIYSPPIIQSNPDDHIIKKGDTPYW